MEAFVYCWTDHKTNMLYIGSHKGSIDDGYICSSKYMMEEYSKRPTDFTRQIIAEGTVSDIRRLETKLLQAVNAKLDEKYYNKHQNDGFFFDGWKKGTMSEEHRKKIGDANKNRAIKQETREKLRKSAIHQHKNSDITGYNNPNYGKYWSSEQKEAMSIMKRGVGKGKKVSPETKEKMSLARKKYWEDRRIKAGG